MNDIEAYMPLFAIRQYLLQSMAVSALLISVFLLTPTACVCRSSGRVSKLYCILKSCVRIYNVEVMNIYARDLITIGTQCSYIYNYYVL